MAAAPEVQILWSDTHLVVVSKPAGLPSLPDGYEPQAPHLKSLLEPDFGRLWIVHRLDRDTSGVVVLARSANDHRALNTQFARRETAKIYHALVAGIPDWQEKDVRLALRPDGDRQHRTIIDPRQGKPAHTHLRLLERYASSLPRGGVSAPRGWALLEATPTTGRTHQLRAHLSALGLPILGDRLYGGSDLALSQLKAGVRQERPLLTRLALHAWSLTIRHPSQGELLTFTASYPKDLQVALRLLRKYGLLT